MIIRRELMLSLRRVRSLNFTTEPRNEARMVDGDFFANDWQGD